MISSLVVNTVWWWFGSHFEEWAAALPSAESNEGEIAVAEAELEKPIEQRTSLLLDRVRYGLNDTDVAPALAVIKQQQEEVEARLLELHAAGLPAGASVSDILDKGLKDMTDEEWKAAHCCPLNRSSSLTVMLCACL